MAHADGALVRCSRWPLALRSTCFSPCNRYFIIIALVAALGAGVVSPCFAIIYSNVLQSFFRPSDVMESEAASYTGQFMAIACSILVATVLRIGLWYMLGEELTAKLRGLAFENLVRCEMAYFDVPEHSTGSLDTRLSADASLVKGATGEGLSQVFQCSSAIIAAVVIAMMASWRLGLIIVAAFPFLILATYFMNQTFTGFERNAKAALEASGHVAVEACTAIRTVTSLNLQPLMVEKFSEGMDERLKSGVKKAMSIAGGQAFAQFMTFALFSLAFYAGGRFMADGLLTFQNLLQVFFAIQMAAQTVASAQSFGPDRAKSKVALKSVFDIIDRPSRINPCDLSTGIRPSTFKGKIEFRNVCFAYPSRPERWVLRNFSMTIMPGQSCALVGESGCGKSSVILLILRFYEPQSGEILLDDVPIRQLNVRWLRENCALVQQEPALFADSIQYVLPSPLPPLFIINAFSGTTSSTAAPQTRNQSPGVACPSTRQLLGPLTVKAATRCLCQMTLSTLPRTPTPCPSSRSSSTRS